MDIYAPMYPKPMESKNILTNPFGQPIGASLNNYQPCIHPRDVQGDIVGKYVILEKLDIEKHLDGLWQIFSQVEDSFFTYLYDGPFKTKDEYRDTMKSWLATPTEQKYAIFDKTSKQLLGTIGLMRIDPVHNVIEVGPIYFSPLISKKRTGTDTLFTIMKFIFEDLKYRRFEWKCDALNIPSRVAALRYGYTFEGLFRKAIIYKDARERDTSWYAMIDDDWFGYLKAGYEAYLDEKNFSQTGLQIKKLQECWMPLKAAYDAKQGNFIKSKL